MKKLFLSLPLILVGLIAEAQPTVILGIQNVNSTSYNQDGYIVESGGELHLGPGTYKFNPGHGIDVLTHGYLQMNGTVTNFECNSTSSSDYWKGITIYGDPLAYSPTNLYPENWGFRTNGEFNITQAETGVMMTFQLGDYNNTTGEIDIVGSGYARSIQSDNSTTCDFVNNRYYDIRIINDVVAENHSSSGNGIPSGWVDYEFTSNSNDFIMSMEFMSTNLVPYMEDFHISSPSHAVYLSNSNAQFTSCKVYALNTNKSGIVHRIGNNNLMQTIIKHSTIEASRHGIYSRESEDILISNNLMKAEQHCIYLKETLNAKIFSNKLRLSQYGLEAYMAEGSLIENNLTHDNSLSDFKITSCNDTKMTSNLLGNGSTSISLASIDVFDSKNTRVVRNVFYESARSIYFHGFNPIVKIHCNTFHEATTGPMNAAIIVADDPINDQGNPTDGGANNYFNLLAPGTTRVLNTTGTTLNFTNTQGIVFGPNFPSTGANFFTDPTFNANCIVAKLAQEDTEINVVSPSPNPFTDVLTIGENITEVQLFNIGGQRVETIKPLSTEINLGHLDSGVYFMVTRDVNGKQNRHKIIKQ